MNNINWTCEITLDGVSHIHFGAAFLDLEKDEQKEARKLFRTHIQGGMKKDLACLQQSNHRVISGKENLTIENITPDTLMEVCNMILEWTGELGDLYQDDLRAMIPVDDILNYLEENDEQLLIQFQAYLDENFWD